MIVYLDLILLTSLFFDTAIIMMTAKMRHIQIKIWRTGIAVILGAAYEGFMFVPELQIMYTVFAKLTFAFLVVYIVFGFGGLQQYLRNTGTMYLLYFGTAGTLFAIHFLLLSSGEVINQLLLTPSGEIAFAIQSGIWLSFPTFIASLWFLRSVFASKQRADAIAHQLAKVSVRIGEWSTACKGLVDTGNHLYDPLSRAPVLVMELENWRDMLPRSLQQRIVNREADRVFTDLEDEPFIWEDRLRLIPYRGAGGGSAFMLAIKPDQVTITTENASYTAQKVLVAFDAGKLSASGAYQAIIHPMLMQG
jgi:stage II sporulation protein GA (sporulation sigma-E factor processing peptidase)